MTLEPAALFSFARKSTELPKFLPAAGVLHICIIAGKTDFTCADRPLTLTAPGYAIITSAAMCTELKDSADFQGIYMLLSPRTIGLLHLRSTYGTIGHLALTADPRLKLTAAEAERCYADLTRLCERSQLTSHHYLQDMLLSLLAAHVLDLYDLHQRHGALPDLSSGKGQLLQRFITLLEEGHYRQERSLKFYADKLFISPHYLSELCRALTGKSAGYWIERYTLQALILELTDTSRTLGQIADRFNFSTAAYFTRFFKQRCGLTPSAFRRRRRQL